MSITISRSRAERRRNRISQAIESGLLITRGGRRHTSGCSCCCFFFCSLETASADLPSFPPRVWMRRPSLVDLSSPAFRSSPHFGPAAHYAAHFLLRDASTCRMHRKDRPADLLSRVRVRGTHGAPVITSLARILIRA